MIWVCMSWTNWTWFQAALFAAGAILAQEIIDFFASIMISRPSVAKILRRALKVNLKNVDYAFILFNKLFTVVFLHYLLCYLYNTAGVIWQPREATFLNTVICFVFLVVGYDCSYYAWHRFLHWSPMYATIHKFHHREISPWRGSLDAVNAHPIE
jgi:sterol desaturase/sphingolipid hydroxylase (fatty acid hydroxylase superfamily)